MLEDYTKTFVDAFYNKQNRSVVYTIPVVFHVIHQYGSENISDAQILDGLDILNKTFRKQLADTASIVAVFKPLHADCEIEFKLAKKDPLGNCTSGINRIASPLTAIGDHAVKNLIHWDPTKYLNVYIVKNAAGLAGHCVWPSDADTIPEWDGVVIAHNYVGSIGTSNYTRSVAFAHECGHYLNLQHIWGGNNVPGFYYLPCADTGKDCSIDDLVADTPPTIGWTSCNLSGASCGNVVDNVQNTMDYSYCNRMFTYGQKARMQACLNSPIAGRNNLWSSSNLFDTGIDTLPIALCYADFTANKTAICPIAPSNTVTFTNLSYNGPFTGVLWEFEGGAPSSSTSGSPTVTYTMPGSYNVKLRVYNGSDSIETIKNNYISVLPVTGTTFAYSESFETIDSLSGIDWYASSVDTINQWEICNGVAYSGNKSLKMHNYTNTSGTKDELIGPIIDLSSASVMYFNFKYAFIPKDTICEDRLLLYITSNCNTSWAVKFNLTGSALQTALPSSGEFIPSAISEWKEYTTAIPSSFFTSDFRFKFVYTSYGGNNLYIDDINIDVDAGMAENNLLQSEVNVFPNPADEKIQLRFNLLYDKKIAFTICNLLGEKITELRDVMYSEGFNTVTIPINDIAKGIYYIQLVTENKIFCTQKFVKQ